MAPNPYEGRFKMARNPYEGRFKWAPNPYEGRFKMTPNPYEGSAPWPNPACVEAWLAPAQPGAQPWLVGSLVRRQKTRPNPPSIRRCSRVQPGSIARLAAGEQPTGVVLVNSATSYSRSALARVGPWCASQPQPLYTCALAVLASLVFDPAQLPAFLALT